MPLPCELVVRVRYEPRRRPPRRRRWCEEGRWWIWALWVALALGAMTWLLTDV